MNRINTWNENEKFSPKKIAQDVMGSSDDKIIQTSCCIDTTKTRSLVIETSCCIDTTKE